MAKDHLSVDEFFMQLADLFDKSRQRDHGSVFLSQKRLTHGSDMEPYTGKKGQVDTLADLHSKSPLPVIVRATNGDSKSKIKSKIKLSILVQPDDLESFYTRYAELCKAGMSSLKKRDRSKKKSKKRKGASEGEK